VASGVYTIKHDEDRNRGLTRGIKPGGWCTIKKQTEKVGPNTGALRREISSPTQRKNPRFRGPHIRQQGTVRRTAFNNPTVCQGQPQGDKKQRGPLPNRQSSRKNTRHYSRTSKEGKQTIHVTQHRGARRVSTYTSAQRGV